MAVTGGDLEILCDLVSFPRQTEGGSFAYIGEINVGI